MCHKFFNLWFFFAEVVGMKSVILFIYIFIAVASYTHPHIQILTRSKVEFEDDSVKGVWMEWEFDEYFSADIILSYDLDEDSNFTREETDDIYNNAFISLKDYDYFTYIREGERRWSPKEVENFSVDINNENVIYKFFVPLNIESRTFSLAVYDFTYFCAVFYQESEPLTFVNIDNSPSFTIEENLDHPIYFNPYAGVGDTTVYTRMEEGLVELFIKEIQIEY